MTTKLGLLAGFHMVEFGLCSGSKEAARPPQGGGGHVTPRGSCTYQLGAWRYPWGRWEQV